MRNLDLVLGAPLQVICPNVVGLPLLIENRTGIPLGEQIEVSLTNLGFRVLILNANQIPWEELSFEEVRNPTTNEPQLVLMPTGSEGVLVIETLITMTKNSLGLYLNHLEAMPPIALKNLLTVLSLKSIPVYHPQTNEIIVCSLNNAPIVLLINQTEEKKELSICKKHFYATHLGMGLALTPADLPFLTHPRPSTNEIENENTDTNELTESHNLPLGLSEQETSLPLNKEENPLTSDSLSSQPQRTELAFQHKALLSNYINFRKEHVSKTKTKTKEEPIDNNHLYKAVLSLCSYENEVAQGDFNNLELDVRIQDIILRAFWPHWSEGYGKFSMQQHWLSTNTIFKENVNWTYIRPEVAGLSLEVAALMATRDYEFENLYQILVECTETYEEEVAKDIAEPVLKILRAKFYESSYTAAAYHAVMHDTLVAFDNLWRELNIAPPENQPPLWRD